MLENAYRTTGNKESKDDLFSIKRVKRNSSVCRIIYENFGWVAAVLATERLSDRI